MYLILRYINYDKIYCILVFEQLIVFKSMNLYTRDVSTTSRFKYLKNDNIFMNQNY